MDAKTIIPIVIQISMLLVVASIGLQSKWSDLGYTLNKPTLLLRGFLAVNVAVPVVAIIVLLPLPLEPVVKLGLAVMAISPLAPFAPGKMLKAGAETAFVVGLYVGLLAIAVIAVPATFALLKPLFPGGVTIGIGAVAWLVFTSILLPLVAGIVVATLAPRAAPKLSKICSILAYLGLLVAVLPVLFMARHQLLALVGNGTLVAIVAIVLGGLAAGHLLGAPDPRHRVALAQAAATRHPGIAALIINHNFDDKRAMLAVVMFLLISIIVCAVYSKWAHKRLAPIPDQDAPGLPA